MSSITCPRCGSLLSSQLPTGVCAACFLAQVAAPVVDAVVAPAAARQDHDGAAEPRFEPGEFFGPYRIERLLGRGGMGEVYEAEHLVQHRRVALKVLHERLRRADDRARFLGEGQLAASVNHPNVVYVFSSEEIGRVPVIAMELMAEGTLKDRVRDRGPLPAAEAVDAILQVMAGLEAAYAAGVLHRDIKPANCFVGRDGTVKIGDFGLSIPMGPRRVITLTSERNFQGTPAFAAPEQMSGETLDVRADIHGVGATLYYLLTGQPPFDDPDPKSYLTRVAAERVTSRRFPRPRLPRDLDRVIMRCVATSRDARPTSYADLRAQLTPFSSRAAVPAPPFRRLAALLIDSLLVVPGLGILIGGLVGSGILRSPATVITTTFALMSLVYWTVFEAGFGASIGMRTTGLRVVTRDGSLPGGLKALARGAILLAPFACTVLAGHALSQSSSGSPWPIGLFVTSVLSVVVTVLASSGEPGPALHDRLTGTQVLLAQETVEPVAPDRTAVRLPHTTTGRIGPYELLAPSEVGEPDNFFNGYDPRLKRRVWIHLVPAGTPLDALRAP